MRIDSPNPVNGNSGANGVDNGQSTQAKGAPQQPVTLDLNDTFELSSGQETFGNLVSQLSQVPDVRQDQVSAYSSAISSGRYNPSNGQVADAIAAQSFGLSEGG